MKKIPQRKCIGCNENKNKTDLIRVVANKENEVFIDFNGKQNGRGAYICKNIECILTSQKTRALERSLKVKSIESIYNDLLKKFN